MTSRSSLFVALAVVAVAGIGVGVAQLGLRDDGIEFPDGSVQTTAAGLLGAPLQVRVDGAIQDLEFCGSFDLYNVPPGKRLLIEWITVTAASFDGAEAPVTVNIDTWLGGVERNHPLVRLEDLQNLGESFFFRESWNSEVKLYSQGGQTVGIFACRDGNGATGMSITVSFHGLLMDQ